MDLKDILAISGHPGLYKFISQGRSAMIVENLEDKKRMSAFASSKISSLEDIAVFTDDEDIPMADVLKLIYEKEKGKPAIDHKSPSEDLKKYFEEVLPEYDRNRVYVSDIKKIVLWYNLLLKLDMVRFDEEDQKEEDLDVKEKNGEKDDEQKEEKGEKKSSEPKSGKGKSASR